jgi:hypothetical protein
MSTLSIFLSTLFTLITSRQRVVPSDVRYPRSSSIYILHRRHVFYAHNSSLPCSELEAREPANAIKFSKAAKAHLDSLGLAKGSAERKQVKEYHRNIVAAEMAKNGATSAQIKYVPLRRYCRTI